jgi:ubiquinone/menaquinone biosynthesis C-methylase UbiE
LTSSSISPKLAWHTDFSDVQFEINMQSQDYADMYALEDTLWWFVGMRSISASLLDPVLGQLTNGRVLEAGCGTGANIGWLKAGVKDPRVFAIDLSGTALRCCSERKMDRLAQASVTDLPFADSSFDLLTSFDVLVQLPDKPGIDRAVGEMARVLKPGGWAFVRLAAYEWMMSDHDRALGTRHRLSLNELREKLEAHGFQVLRATYANCLLLPVAMFRRKILKPLGISRGSDVKPLPAALAWINSFLAAPLKLEAAWLKSSNRTLPFGLSAVCVARKRQD